MPSANISTQSKQLNNQQTIQMRHQQIFLGIFVYGTVAIKTVSCSASQSSKRQQHFRDLRGSFAFRVENENL